ncbi:hypothetical protein COOONC_11477, partial [Cooperia oncophora]
MLGAARSSTVIDEDFMIYHCVSRKFLRLFKAGDSCEREIDATDPLRPSANELSGAKLLLRKAIKEQSPDTQPTVPGQVVRNHKLVKTTVDSKRGRSSEPRLGTAASQHTFVIETERRRPLLLPVGLTEGALEYRKAQEALRKAREQEEKRLQREQAEREAAEARERERISIVMSALEYRKAQEALRKAREQEEKRLQREQAEREAAEARERERQRLYRPNVSARKPPMSKKETTGSRESLISHDTSKAKRSPIRKSTFYPTQLAPLL